MELLLDEYVDITIKIRNIQDKIFDYKKDVETKLAKEKSQRKRDKIIQKFRNFTDKIKQSNGNYKSLVNKQKNIKDTILKNSILDMNNSLSYLKNKYERLSNTKVKITNSDSNIKNKINNILSKY